MTNHIHLIVERRGEQKIEDIIRDFKKYTSVHSCRSIEGNLLENRKFWMLNIFKSAGLDSKKHVKYKFWQNEYHPVELYNNSMIDQSLIMSMIILSKKVLLTGRRIIFNNSARDYAGKKGLLEIEFMD